MWGYGSLNCGFLESEFAGRNDTNLFLFNTAGGFITSEPDSPLLSFRTYILQTHRTSSDWIYRQHMYAGSQHGLLRGNRLDFIPSLPSLQPIERSIAPLTSMAWNK